MVFGDRRQVELRGAAPKEPGEAALRLVFLAPFRNPWPVADREAKLRWR
jgi:hypothetical protein